jgi:hypothetical protein
VKIPLFNTPIMEKVKYLEAKSRVDDRRIAELEDLAQMIIDADSADEGVRPMMYHVWLFKAQRLLGSSK